MDARTLDWVAATDHGWFGRLLGGVARANDVLAPFLVVSAWSLRRGTGNERAAVRRGWAAMAVAAAVDSGVLKPLTRRQRPDPDRLPPDQRPSASPSTSAFPSGHAGAATAFAVAAGRGSPRLGAVLGVTAAANAYARVFTGRHYLSDVLAGTTVGALTGLLCSGRPRKVTR